MRNLRKTMLTKNLIIDATNIYYRTFYIARKELIYNKNNERIESIEKFLETILRLIKKFAPLEIWCCWDEKLESNKSNFRKDTLEGKYKAGRIRPDDYAEMKRQQGIIIDILSNYGIHHMYPNRLEADDCVSFLSQKLKGSKIIVSTDKDLYQLLNDDISIYNLQNLITFEKFKKEQGLTPKEYLLFRAIKGDASDNIKGVPGYGEKRGKKLLINFNWDTLPLNEEYKNIIKRNIVLMDLHKGFKIQKGEQEELEKQYSQERINLKRDIEKFIQMLDENGLSRNRDYEWKENFRKVLLVDMINSIPNIRNLNK